MNRIALITFLLLGGCSGDHLLSGLEGGGPPASVCVQGDAGSCCSALSEICTTFDEGCKVGGKAPRTPTRCMLCWPDDIDDGGARDRNTPPPNPAPDSGVYTDADGGIHDPRILICGPATYHDP